MKPRHQALVGVIGLGHVGLRLVPNLSEGGPRALSFAERSLIKDVT